MACCTWRVKNVTLMQDGRARFPDAKTTRGAKHLGELMRLKAEGARAAAVYVVQRMGLRGFRAGGRHRPGLRPAFPPGPGRGRGGFGLAG